MVLTEMMRQAASLGPAIGEATEGNRGPPGCWDGPQDRIPQ